MPIGMWWCLCTSCFLDTGISGPLIVDDGEDIHLGYDEETGRPLHTRQIVYHIMFIQICLMYRSLPDPRTLTYNEIEMYYNGIRKQLIEDSKQVD